MYAITLKYNEHSQLRGLISFLFLYFVVVVLLLFLVERGEGGGGRGEEGPVYNCTYFWNYISVPFQ